MPSPNSCQFLHRVLLATFLLWQNTMTKATYKRIWGSQLWRVKSPWLSWWGVWQQAGRHGAGVILRTSHFGPKLHNTEAPSPSRLQDTCFFALDPPREKEETKKNDDFSSKFSSELTRGSSFYMPLIREDPEKPNPGKIFQEEETMGYRVNSLTFVCLSVFKEESQEAMWNCTKVLCKHWTRVPSGLTAKNKRPLN